MPTLLPFLLLLLLLLSSAASASVLPNHRLLRSSSPWQTLSGSPPLIVSRGDNGIFPDQTQLAYLFAAQYVTSNESAFLCDVQLTKDGAPICRTGLDLSLSTNINTTLPNLQSKHTVNGKQVSGFFSVDVTLEQLFLNVSAQQANFARPLLPASFYILTPDLVYNFTAPIPLWLNVEYPSFYSQLKLDIEGVIEALPPLTPISYLSSPEVGFLKAVKPRLPKTTKLLLKFLDKTETEPTTSQTYATLLANLSAIAGYASGIVVPKDYIWPVDPTTHYLSAESTLIADAHAANLVVYGYDFVNEIVYPYNYSFNPVSEYLQFAPENGSNIDGFLTDFPVTALEALACYRSVPSLNEAAAKTTTILSHNGASGDFPGCTRLAYDAAVRGGAAYIDCTVQMTKDGVAICRESPDLLTNTDVSTHSNFFPSRVSNIPNLEPPKGLYTFNMTYEEIKTLKATSDSSDLSAYDIELNPAFDGLQEILSLSDFLSYAKNQSVNVLVNIQNGYFLYTELGLDVLGTVISNLTSAGFSDPQTVFIQSEDSAVLRRLKDITNATLVYRVTSTNSTITDAVVEEIKAFATHVTLPKGLVQQVFQFYLLNNTGIVDVFHKSNMTVFVSALRNVFVTLPYDYESDPLAEISTMVNIFDVDGIITEFPATATAYLKNGCQDTKTEKGGLNYAGAVVRPGDFLTFLTSRLSVGFYSPQPPGPLLNVTQATLPPSAGSGATPSSLGNNGTSVAPAAAPSSSAAARGKGYSMLLTTVSAVWLLLTRL